MASELSAREARLRTMRRLLPALFAVLALLPMSVGRAEYREAVQQLFSLR